MSPIIGGALVDYYGGKRVMAYGVALWSLATFLSPWAAGRSISGCFSLPESCWVLQKEWHSQLPKHEQHGVEVSTFVTLFLLITSSPTFSPQKRIVVWLWGFLLRFI